MPKTQPQEYERFEGEPLSARRLAAIWKGLPEREKLGFILALDEQIADEVMAMTIKQESSAVQSGAR